MYHKIFKRKLHQKYFFIIWGSISKVHKLCTSINLVICKSKVYELFCHNAKCKHVHQARWSRACKCVSFVRWTFLGWKYFSTLWERGFYKPLIVHEIVGSIFSQWQNMFFMYSKFHFYHGMSSFKFFYTFWFPPMVKGKYI